MGIYKFLRSIYRKIREIVFSTATIISPTINTKLRYRYLFGKKLNLKDPRTFNEKLLWLKLKKYNRDPLVIKCADKYLVREYVEDCGCKDILNDLIGAWDSVDEIPWEELPQKFVLKWNFGAGMNIICEDKNKLDRDEVFAKLKKWRKNKCWLSHSEMQYKYMPRKIVCERFLKAEGESSIPDYKVYCFHGVPKAILVMHDRGHGELKTEFFDAGWNLLENTGKYNAPSEKTPRPGCLNKLLEISGDLSKPFPFVRCDLYVIKDKIYFGELTFTPAGGLYTSQTKVDGKEMADLLSIQ
ncbi:MAG: glycosyl transferase [Clostridia bacterium]|nr:glycosyl transferase [Clostridia bacterium]